MYVCGDDLFFLMEIFRRGYLWTDGQVGGWRYGWAFDRAYCLLSWNWNLGWFLATYSTGFGNRCMY